MNKLLVVIAAATLAAGTAAAHADTVFSQGFETDTSGWFTAGGYGTIDRVPTGTNGIPAASGSYFAIVNGAGTDSTGPYTKFGGYSSNFGGGWSASLDIYLDPTALTSGQGFDYSVASNNNTGSFLRDFIFHVSESSSNKLLINASNNSSDMPPAGDLTGTPGVAEVTTAGWYTFTADFTDQGGALAGTLSVSNGGGTLFSKTLSDPSDLIAGVGGNRYGWFTFVSAPNGIAIDNTQLSVVPLPSAATMGLGMLAAIGAAGLLRKKLATA